MKELLSYLFPFFVVCLILHKLQVQVGHLHGRNKLIRASVRMEASGFRSGRCCRSRRLRKQSRGTHQTVPPGCGSPASCEGVRSAHQQQTRCTLGRRIQWRHPWARRLGTAHCDARFGDALRLCRDERRRLWFPTSPPWQSQQTRFRCPP